MNVANIKRWLLGKPLENDLESNERLNIPLGLAVFASDALSSTAYATEEILIALMASQYALQAHQISLPVALTIGLLIAIVVTSYRQVIQAYPDGGGAYVSAKENLGQVACLVAGASLLLDYILTVAVSVSAGVAALTSTGWLEHSASVSVALMLVLAMTLLNLRGMKESAKVVAFPAFIFIALMFGLILMGLYRVWSGDIPDSSHAASVATEGTSGLVLNTALALAFFKAFSHGCAALTGIEAVSNGVKAFKEPSANNANKTLVLMGCILGGMFIGVTYLAFAFNITPSHTETVVSQIARAVFGGQSIFYYGVQIFTMIVLVLAANTAFAGFPRLASLLASDGFLPRQLTTLGDRLVFSNGITVLGLVSALLIWAYQADTHSLIPLYAVGVFLSFTLAQWGMVVYHKRLQHDGWQRGLMINGFGGLVTGVVTLLLAIEKFWEGAWIILLAIPLMIFVFLRVYNHYRCVARQLVLPAGGYCPVAIEHTVLVLVSSLNRGTIPALEYARTISDRVEAVHVLINPISTENLKRQWSEWGCGIPLVVLESPYRSIIEPIMKYVHEVEDRYEHDLVTIIVPEFVTKRFWHNFLHNQTAILLKALLRGRKGKVVTTVRYHLEE